MASRISNGNSTSLFITLGNVDGYTKGLPLPGSISVGCASAPVRRRDGLNVSVNDPGLPLRPRRTLNRTSAPSSPLSAPSNTMRPEQPRRASVAPPLPSGAGATMQVIEQFRPATATVPSLTPARFSRRETTLSHSDGVVLRGRPRGIFLLSARHPLLSKVITTSPFNIEGPTPPVTADRIVCRLGELRSVDSELT